MESKHELNNAMQRVMNDMTLNDPAIKPIAFIEVAKMLARIGQEQVEPELIDATNSMLSLSKGKGNFFVEHHVKPINLVAHFINKFGKADVKFIDNTKEQLFYFFLNSFTNKPTH
ncbi:TPA: hypothetical protein ACQVKY_005202 [Serratia marcescens]|uniref:Uncharacterized protein n=1 Tax=Serratia nevei TaxID=2703794 RepID=A0ABT7G6E8_9GAMM|nr:hypothetical protein [Serratia nevei]HAU4290838.1 hypothetical protein [Serratia marcescens]MDK5169008.1 hypothetical protein [Serratia nevei]MDK5298502.1 hypothetical protein [Serratia nevei]MEC5887246.1 hypothetical protein [Serratia nevei]HAU4297508.1 hypothetical protein [Serratia marcescens]